MKYKLLMVLIGLLSAGCLAAQAQSISKMYIIVNKKNPVTSLTATQIGKIYLKKTRFWEDGSIIDPVGQKDDAAMSFLLHDIFHSSYRFYELYWMREELKGTLKAPVLLSNDQAVIEYVASHPNAIGCVTDRVILSDAKVNVILTSK